MTYINHRQALQILCIGPGGNNIVIIGNKFCVDSGFFTGCHDLLQFIVFVQSQGDGDLIQAVMLQNILQAGSGADHFYIFIQSSRPHGIIQNTVHLIAPLRVLYHPVDKLFRSPAVAHHENMLQVHASAPDVPQQSPYHIPFNNRQHIVYAGEYENQGTGEVRLVHHVEDEHDQQYADGIGAENVAGLQSSSLHPFWRIQIEAVIEQQESGNHKYQCQHINLHRKCSCPVLYNQMNLNVPGQNV